MKKFLTLALTAAMLMQGAVSAFADDVGFVLAEGSHLKVENGIVDMIDGTITVGELKAEFTGAVDVAGKADDAAVCADDTVTAGGETAKAIIWGDASKDGKITLTDATRMLQSIAKWSVDISEIAGDVDRNDKLTLADVSKLLQKLAKWDNISLGNVRMVFENKANKIDGEDNTIKLFFTNMMEKNGRKDTAFNGNYSYKMTMGRNETESCQVLMTSETEREGLSASLSEFVYEYGEAVLESKLEWIKYYDHNLAYPIMTDEYKGNSNWLNREGCVVWHDDEYPEIVLPMADTFELEAQKLQHMVISVTSTKDSPAGMYKAVLELKDEEGKVVKSVPVYAYVWDFTLPDAPYSASLFCTQWESGKDGKYSYKDYYDYMLDNNLSSYVLPYEIDEPEAEAYMSDPRVSAFVIAGTAEKYGAIMGESDEDTKKYFEIVQSNPEWAKKGLFYYTDEPWGEGLLEVKTTYEHLVDVLGTTEGIRNITPLAGNNTYVDKDHQNRGIDPVEYIKDYINVWCTSSAAFMDTLKGGYFTTRRSLSMYGEFRERAEAFRERGDEIWWYTCCGPEIPYTNLFTWYQGVVIRDLWWQQYMNDVNGFLYYGTGVHWNQISKYRFNIYNGDGVLMYPGEYFGCEGPCASWRLYQVRDAYDDFDYLRMAEEIVGRENVMKIVSKVTTGMLNYTEEFSDLEAARAELIQILVNADK
ncbi:MAG: DUF4091 domain-containing protein [Ruminococcaceae bacterium]|nr:DUF4091 domain-containing protein [Oscillospiraceae bacterium]